jgi:hypothetical protein
VANVSDFRTRPEILDRQVEPIVQSVQDRIAGHYIRDLGSESPTPELPLPQIKILVRHDKSFTFVIVSARLFTRRSDFCPWLSRRTGR